MKNLIYLLVLIHTSAFAQQSFWKPVDEKFDSLILILEKINLDESNPQKEKEVIEQMFLLADNLKKPVLRSRAIQFKVTSTYYNKPDSALIYLNLATSLIDTTEYKYDYYKILGGKAIIYRTQGDYLKSYKTFIKLLSYYQKIEDHLNTANTLARLGAIMEILMDYSKAKAYFVQAGSIYTKHGYKKLALRNKMYLSNVYYRNNQKDEAIEMFETLLSNPDVSKDDDFKANLLLSLYTFSTDSIKKEEYVKESYKLAKKLNNLLLVGKSAGNLVDYYRSQNEFDSAMIYYNEAYPYFEKFKDIGSLRILFANKYLMFMKKKQWDSAFHYSQLYHHYNDSILSINKSLEINKIETIAAFQKSEQEKKEANLQRKITLAILFGVCCLSIAALSIIYFRNKKIRIQKRLKEIENKELNERLKNELLQKENLQLEIGSKNRELTSNTLLLTEKNRVLESFAYQIKELEFTGKLASKQEKKLQKQIQDHLQTADEWEYFKLHFESVHPDFFSKLKEFASSISENDLRLCAYIRIGMENKQIAQMLSVLPATINTSRYRIRKKLNIVGDISLEDFLRNL